MKEKLVVKNGEGAKCGNVSHIEDYKPHLTVNCGECVHVISISLIEDVISGKKDFTELERWDELLKTILKDWLSSMLT